MTCPRLCSGLAQVLAAASCHGHLFGIIAKALHHTRLWECHREPTGEGPSISGWEQLLAQSECWLDFPERTHASTSLKAGKRVSPGDELAKGKNISLKV